VIHPATHIVLLAFVALWILVVVSGLLLLLLWLLWILLLSIVPLILGSLHIALGTIIGIMSKFTTFEIAIGLNWIVVVDWCS